MCIIFLINKLYTCFNFIKEIVFIQEDMRYYFQTKFVFGKLLNQSRVASGEYWHYTPSSESAGYHGEKRHRIFTQLDQL